MDLQIHDLRLPYKHGHFTISAGTTTDAHTLLIEADDGRHKGLGEACPSHRVTGQDADIIRSHIQKAGSDIEHLRVPPSETPPPSPMTGRLGPAACALDGALLDLWGHVRDEPVWRLLGLPRPKAPTSVTISLADATAMAEEAARYRQAGFHILKVKLGTGPDQDLRRIQAIREAVPDCDLRIDGNEGWTLDDATTLMPAFAEAGVSLIEQPLPRDVPDHQVRALSRIAADHDVAHIIDEGVHGAADAERIGAGRLAHGINIKLQKAGGLRPALAALKVAREHDLGVMVGCFIETWAGIALAVQMAGAVDWVDLDGAWLLAEEPVVGTGGPLLQDGVLRGSDRPGLGVALSG